MNNLNRIKFQKKNINNIFLHQIPVQSIDEWEIYRFLDVVNMLERQQWHK